MILFLIILVVTCSVYFVVSKNYNENVVETELEKILIEANNDSVKAILNTIVLISTIIAYIAGAKFIDVGDAHCAYIAYFIYITILIILFTIGKMKLFVTDKRIFGTAFWKRVDLPFDSISAISKSWLKTIKVSTSSGSITWIFLDKKFEKAYKTISNILIKRQNANIKIKSNQAQSMSDELRECKQLLDEGIITKEEFEKKKKELLKL